MDPQIQELLAQSDLLLKMAQQSPEKFADYSFIVFPAAKAYEGFLKKLFLDLGFITEADYLGNRWRVGKALNPFLEKEWRSESVYDRVVAYCGGKELADTLWETWKSCRNSIFHFFPGEKTNVSLEEAALKLGLIGNAIEDATRGCKIKK